MSEIFALPFFTFCYDPEWGGNGWKRVKNCTKRKMKSQPISVRNQQFYSLECWMRQSVRFVLKTCPWLPSRDLGRNGTSCSCLPVLKEIIKTKCLANVQLSGRCLFISLLLTATFDSLIVTRNRDLLGSSEHAKFNDMRRCLIHERFLIVSNNRFAIISN